MKETGCWQRAGIFFLHPADLGSVFATFTLNEVAFQFSELKPDTYVFSTQGDYVTHIGLSFSPPDLTRCGGEC